MKKNQNILHLLGWEFTAIIEHLDEIANQGFDCIQVSPVQPTKDEGYEWWKLYQPCGLSIGNTQIGTKDELRRLCTEAKEYDIKIIVDVVLRHVAGVNSGELIPHENVDKKLLPFLGEKRNICDYLNRYESTSLSMGMPMLNYKNHEIQDLYVKFLNELIDCGVGGFRIDMGKHFSLPSEGCDFWIRVFNSLKNKENLYNYAECIDCERGLLDEYSKYVNVLTDCEASNHSKMVCFVESHDTYYTFGNTKNLSDNDIINRWDGLVNNCDCSTIFFSRPWSNLWADTRIREINYRHKFKKAC